MTTTNELKFGALLSPIHSNLENPTLALKRDVSLIELLDQLGYDEAWVGEHHSGGWEFVASPEILLSHAAARTSRIRLGGLVSAPFHHPLNVIERYILLDHLSNGRAMLGLGPSALPSDAEALGVSPLDTRERLEQSIQAILALLAGERVSMQTEWFQLDRAALSLTPEQGNGLELVVAAALSPNGPRLAGRHGLGLLSTNATEQSGFGLLPQHWSIVEEQAARYGEPSDRSAWRMLGPMYIAETEAEAHAHVAEGIERWAYYCEQVSVLPVLPVGGKSGTWARTLVDAGVAVIGTPEQAVAQLERLQEQSGGFGTFLIWANDWATPLNTQRSYELFAREVMPQFSRGVHARVEAEEWARSRRPDLQPGVMAAREKARLRYDIERAESIG